MTVSRVCHIDGEEAMVSLGESLGGSLHSGVIHLSGGLGAGKTTLCRGILRSRGYRGAVKSPTYTLVEPYHFDSGQVFHFDLYRLKDPEELEYMGFRDYFEPGNLCIIEWPEMGDGLVPPADLAIDIEFEGAGRKLTIMALSAMGELALSEKDGLETTGNG